MNILHGFKALTAFAVVATLFASCTEEQTSYDVNDVPGKAKIIGSLAYSEGTILEGGQFKELIKPAADKEVYLEIQNSDYQSGATGTQTIKKVQTDSDGKFEVEIPVPANGADITVKPADFTGVFNKIVRKNNEYVAETQNVVYRVGNNSERLQPNQIAYVDLFLNVVDEQQLAEGYDQFVAVTGTIGMGKEKYNAAVTRRETTGMNLQRILKAPQRVFYFDKAANADLLVDITYNGESRSYNCKTNANGEFTLNVPVKDIVCDITYDINILSFTSQYDYYQAFTKTWEQEDMEGFSAASIFYTIDYEKKTLDGYYKQDNAINGTLTYDIAGQVGRIAPLKALLFHPYDPTSEDAAGYSTSSFSNAKWLEEVEKEEEEALKTLLEQFEASQKNN